MKGVIPAAIRVLRAKVLPVPESPIRATFGPAPAMVVAREGPGVVRATAFGIGMAAGIEFAGTDIGLPLVSDRVRVIVLRLESLLEKTLYQLQRGFSNRKKYKRENCKG